MERIHGNVYNRVWRLWNWNVYRSELPSTITTISSTVTGTGTNTITVTGTNTITVTTNSYVAGHMWRRIIWK